jgi:hypothetical protein
LLRPAGHLSLLILAFFLYVGFSAALASIAGVILIFFTFLLDGTDKNLFI